MSKQNIFSCPVNPNNQYSGRVKKSAETMCNKKADRNAVDRKLIIYTAALLILAVLSFFMNLSIKTMWGAFCGISLIFFSVLYKQQYIVNSTILKDNL